MSGPSGRSVKAPTGPTLRQNSPAPVPYVRDGPRLPVQRRPSAAGGPSRCPQQHQHQYQQCHGLGGAAGHPLLPWRDSQQAGLGTPAEIIAGRFSLRYVAAGSVVPGSSGSTSPGSGSGNSAASNSGSGGSAAPPLGGAGPPPSLGAGTPSTAASPIAASGSSSTGQAAAVPQISASESAFTLKPIHVALFVLIFIGGALFATCTLQFTSDMEFTVAVATVLRRVARSVAFRQLVVIAVAILLVRFGLNSVLQALSRWSASPVQWDKTKLYYILREVYQPLELLLCIAALCTIADSFVPSLISVPKTTVTQLVKSVLSMSFIVSAGSVVLNLKGRFCKENAWQSEMKGDVTAQRRWEAYDKLATFIIYAISFVLGIQAIGLEVTSVLAIGGVGGLAIGLAGREIAENLLNGFLIMSTNPFEVGDEVTFFHTNKQVEGFVIDIGWYRTLIRSFEREVYVIPNAVFSKNILLNVTRKNREFRFFEHVSVRVQDASRVNNIIQDVRRIVRSDTRILSKLHRRIFLDRITMDACNIYVSFYVEAQNRDQFMAMKQDMLLAFVDCVERNGAKLAMPRRVMDLDPELAAAIATSISSYDRSARPPMVLAPAGVPTSAVADSPGGNAPAGSGPSVSGTYSSPGGNGGGSAGQAIRAVETTAEVVSTPAASGPTLLSSPPPERDSRQDRDRREGGSTTGSLGSSSGRTGLSSGSSKNGSITANSFASDSIPSISLPSSGPTGMLFAGNNVVGAPSMLRPSASGAAVIQVEQRPGWMEATLRKLASALFE